ATAAVVSAVCQANDHGFGGLGGFSALGPQDFSRDNATHAGITKPDYIYTKLMTLKLDSLVRKILLLSPQ
ncbi:hypothetical protein Tco_1011322, partial [Tanacetum coccineum]